MKKVLLLCALAVPAVAAAAPGDEWYVTPEVGGISPNHERFLRNHDWDYGLVFGRELGPILNLELNLNGARINDGRGFGHLNLYGVSVDALGVFNRPGLFSPYVIGGLGGLRDSPHPGSSDTHFLAEAGLGTFINLWRSPSGTSGFSLRPQVTARWDDPGKGDHLVDYLALLGFQYSFGGSTVSAPVAETAPPPAPPPVVPQPAPAPVAVPATPPDSDHDGVPDSIDKCPDTPAGVQVDATGCPLKGSITLQGVTFEHNSAQLTVTSHPPLDAMADGLKKHPRVKVDVQGYTDSTGSPAYNIKLSQRRADAVRSYLVDSGVSADQLQTHGFGQAQPVASNATAEGRAKNRRVVVFVVSNPGDVKVEGQGATRQ
jgi:OOP family OmpA-OmpF porin